MSLILGLMMSLAWARKENRADRKNTLPTDQRTRINELEVDPDKFAQLSDEVRKLLSEKTRLENALANQSGQAKVLNESLQEIKVFANLTEVEGPGVVVTLRDYVKGGQPKPFTIAEDTIIHFSDVLSVVNELFASGAEAISVQNLRVCGVSSMRCVGTTILINDVKIASPIRIRAIGDMDTLLGAMSMPGGELSKIKQTDPSMVSLEGAKSLRLPAYTGSTSHKILRVPKESK